MSTYVSWACPRLQRSSIVVGVCILVLSIIKVWSNFGSKVLACMHNKFKKCDMFCMLTWLVAYMYVCN